MSKLKASVRVNKKFVNCLIKYKYGTIGEFLKLYKITRMRYWQILNKTHLSKEVPCLKNLAEFLKISVDDMLEE